jgi:hypothetical protein
MLKLILPPESVDTPIDGGISVLVAAGSIGVKKAQQAKEKR